MAIINGEAETATEASARGKVVFKFEKDFGVHKKSSEIVQSKAMGEILTKKGLGKVDRVVQKAHAELAKTVKGYAAANKPAK